MRTCIFCGARASSKEDVWPLWLMDLLGTPGLGTIHAERGNLAPYTWKTLGPGPTVKFVCRPCNNAWMSSLENLVKPIVESLFTLEQMDSESGSPDTPSHSLKRVTLDPCALAVLAAWSVKNAMVYEALGHERQWFFSDKERSRFRETLQPSPATRVWIAACASQLGPYCTSSDMGGVARELPGGVGGYVTTMCFGPLAIQVLAFKSSDLLVATPRLTVETRPGDWDRLALQVWPPPAGPVVWPAPLGLNGMRGLETFGDRFLPAEG